MRADHITTLCALLGIVATNESQKMIHARLHNELDDRGLVSSLCESLDDVPDSDAERAIAQLRDEELRKQGQRELL